MRIEAALFESEVETLIIHQYLFSLNLIAHSGFCPTGEETLIQLGSRLR